MNETNPTALYAPGEDDGKTAVGSLSMELRSMRFRREREAAWVRLEGLLQRYQRGGRAGLSTEELIELPHLYRAALASLSVARNYVLDAKLTYYLDGLAARAHVAIFSSNETLWGALRRVFRRDLPCSVRRLAWPILLAAVCLLLGVLIGRQLVIARPDLFEALVPLDIAKGRTPFAATSDLAYSLQANPNSLLELQGFAFELMRNNITVSLLAIGLGIALGVPTALIMFYNGAIIGALVAVFALRGLELQMLAWLSVHGTTELLALVLAGGAGFAIAAAIMFPEPGQSRLASAAAIGPHIARIGLAVIALMLLAGFLEAFVRSLIGGVADRFAIGGAFTLLWYIYFRYGGRRDPSGGAS